MRNVLSAQKLVNGENVTDFTFNYMFSKKNLERAIKLEHKFLRKQQRHISDFCRSEAAVRCTFSVLNSRLNVRDLYIPSVVGFHE